MMNFKVDKEKCIKCKLCASECPVFIINGKTEFPEIKEGKEPNCLKCQHCMAVCPTAAISIWGKKPEDSISTNSPIPKSTELENLMQIRRSIRKFKKEEVDKDLIQKLVSNAAYAPTGKNENAVLFSVVDNRKDMSKLRELTYNRIKQYFEEGRLPDSYLYLNNFREVWEAKQIDVIFRNAPHLLVTSAPKSGTEPTLDCTIATSYFDLLANSNGLGTLWNGFAKYVFEDVMSEMKNELGIPEEHEISTVLLFGLPAVKFARSVQSDGLNLNTVSL